VHLSRALDASLCPELVAGASLARRRVRDPVATVRLGDGVVVTVRRNRPAKSDAFGPELELRAKRGSAVLATRTLGYVFPAWLDPTNTVDPSYTYDTASVSSWTYLGSRELGGKTFLVMREDSGGSDHGSVECKLVTFACGQVRDVLTYSVLHDFAPRGYRCPAPDLKPVGPLGARWRRFHDRLWSDETCKYEPDDADP
jgi:hypothetical protein